MSRELFFHRLLRGSLPLSPLVPTCPLVCPGPASLRLPPEALALFCCENCLECVAMRAGSMDLRVERTELRDEYAAVRGGWVGANGESAPQV